MSLDKASSFGASVATSLERLVAEPTVVIQPSRGLLHLDLGAVWQYRELLYFLIWRDVKVRYKQTVIGVGWAIIQPVMSMVIFTVIFGNFARIPSDGLPYPLFAYAAILPWSYFSQAIARSGASLVGDANLISKVFFPRVIVPLSSALAPLVDFALAFVVLLGMMAWFGIPPTPAVIAVPLLPFLVQLWMFASPVVYPLSLVPQKWRFLCSLNPMAGVIEVFRWALWGKASP